VVKNARASSTVSEDTSTIVRLPTRTAALSRRSRVPPHVEHGASPMNCAYQRFALSEVASRKRRSSRGRSPSHVCRKRPLPDRPSHFTANVRSPAP
jgi:hypothetical protein